MKERLEAIKKAALEKIEQADAMDSLNDILFIFCRMVCRDI